MGLGFGKSRIDGPWIDLLAESWRSLFVIAENALEFFTTLSQRQGGLEANGKAVLVRIAHFIRTITDRGKEATKKLAWPEYSGY